MISENLPFQLSILYLLITDIIKVIGVWGVGPFVGPYALAMLPALGRGVSPYFDPQQKGPQLLKFINDSLSQVWTNERLRGHSGGY